MDSPSTMLNSAPGSASTLSSSDETLRVKFLCSFSGSILPRPQDGKLRYVGGETRIVSVPRDISYDDLMNRMKELFEGAAILKYQQPDEDLDALVSVVNDDDVTNMMEEYDKLGVGDGFTRLRIFLFSHTEQDGSLHYIDGDDRNSERRYVDALNNMNDTSDFRKQLLDSSMIGAVESMHLTEQFFNPMSGEMGVPHPNLQHLTIPRVGSGQIQIESPWSPVYYSPRHHIPHEIRGEVQTSPPSTRYGMPFSADISDEYPWQQVHRDHHQQQQYHENIVWVPTSGVPSGDMGFPGNLHHVPNVLDGNVCEHCRMSFERSQPHMDIGTRCAECPSVRDNYFVINPNLKPLHTAHPQEQDPRVLYSETSSQERGWAQTHQLNPHSEECRVCAAGAGTVRLNDYAVRDSPSMNFSIGHHNLVDGHHVSPSYAPQQLGLDLVGEIFHESMAGPQHIPVSYVYGVDNNVHGLPHGHHLHPQTVWGNAGNAAHGRSSYEASLSTQPLNGATGPRFLRATPDGSPRFCGEFDNHILRFEPSKKIFGLDSEGPALAINRSGHLPENLHSYARDMLQVPQGVPSNGININESVDVGKKEQNEEGDEAKNMEAPGNEVVNTKQNVKCCESSGASFLMENGIGGKVTELSEANASLKMDPLVGEGDMKDETNAGDPDSADKIKSSKEAKSNGAEGTNTQGELGLGSDDHANNSKIEPTKAEEEAISRGLQAIKYDDLEEIRELGSGTYGAVYHGKWKGSDVAIKKIKASCFAGRPAERERLIADFWKEALMLSSLHHPNVVSFYGIVRDGPDGSLATVTEFMINGSLKQFLRKKDRTIDRRKRLIITMDAAFGMEYLHGKNIVHFDLKCENLLVNMRDPQRPVCKIGDLGLSKVKQHTLVSGGVRGTLPWMAPELLSGKSNMVTEKIDVYSFGIVMWELLTGEEPYADMHCASIIGGIVNNSLRPQIPTWCDPEFKSLMESCWASDPSERPSFSEISQKLRSMAAAINVK
ncbi:hypothetical protein SAY86_014124 [Trapa natans]|uniref:Protein kinase domain-containing protein n=1 Tax=Trapa natans TaxID=22666 RepID=A0AAN7KVT6_TRANT|nr:hypothetical protein SAY86_014124 [Trapa natans]